MPKNWEVEELDFQDIRPIYDLYKGDRGDHISPYDSWIKWWNWLYRDAPMGRSRIWVIRDKERIIGQYPVTFRKLRVAGKLYDTAQNIDLLTDPDYRGKGVFGALERKGMSELSKAGIKFVWGFPNKAATPGHVKNGWRPICGINWYLMPINIANLGRAKMKLGPMADALRIPSSVLTKINGGWLSLVAGKNAEVRRVERIPEKAESLLSIHATKRDFSFVRTVDYLNWRYVDCPDATFRCHVVEGRQGVRGLIVTGVEESDGLRLGYIYDLIVDDGDNEAFRGLIGKCFEEFRGEGVDAACYPSSYDGWMTSELFFLGFSNPMFFKNMSLYGASLDPAIMEAVSEKGRKFVQWGDSDAVAK